MAENIQYGEAPTVLDRSTTGKRVLLSILFVAILHVLASVLACVVLFELGYSLVTRRPPKSRVRNFAQRIVRYGYHIGMYVTCNTDSLPFPFEELPN